MQNTPKHQHSKELCYQGSCKVFLLTVVGQCRQIAATSANLSKCRLVFVFANSAKMIHYISFIIILNLHHAQDKTQQNMPQNKLCNLFFMTFLVQAYNGNIFAFISWNATTNLAWPMPINLIDYKTERMK